MKNGKILIIDDEVDVGRLFIKSLPQFNVLHAVTSREGLEMVGRENPDLVFLDLMLPDTTGIKTLKRIKQISATTVVIIMTGHGEIESAVKAMRLGAYDYLTKPVPLHRLRIIANNAIEMHRLDREVKELKQGVNKVYSLDRVITVNKKMQEVS